MKLPNAARAIVDIEKLRDYCLSESHPRGKHKARVFATVLRLTATDVFELRDAMISAVQTEEAVVRSAWIVRRGEDVPRLTSCYVL